MYKKILLLISFGLLSVHDIASSDFGLDIDSSTEFSVESLQAVGRRMSEDAIIISQKEEPLTQDLDDIKIQGQEQINLLYVLLKKMESFDKKMTDLNQGMVRVNKRLNNIDARLSQCERHQSKQVVEYRERRPTLSSKKVSYKEEDKQEDQIHKVADINLGDDGK